MSVSNVWAVASEIEWNAARERAKAYLARRHGSWTRLNPEAREQAITAEYDAHAATELGWMLIYRLGLRPAEIFP